MFVYYPKKSSSSLNVVFFSGYTIVGTMQMNNTLSPNRVVTFSDTMFKIPIYVKRIQNNNDK